MCIKQNQFVEDCMKVSLVYVEGIEELADIETDFYYSVLLIYSQQNLAWRSF